MAGLLASSKAAMYFIRQLCTEIKCHEESSGFSVLGFNPANVSVPRRGFRGVNTLGLED